MRTSREADGFRQRATSANGGIEPPGRRLPIGSYECERGESNPHPLRDRILRRVWLRAYAPKSLQSRVAFLPRSAIRCYSVYLEVTFGPRC